MNGVEYEADRVEVVPPLATDTDTETLRSQQSFLMAWRDRELERAGYAKGSIYAGCIAQVKYLEREIARNNRFLVLRGLQPLPLTSDSEAVSA